MTPEFSRLLDTTKLAHIKNPLTFMASPEECAAIAERLGVLEISNFNATVYATFPKNLDPAVQLDIELIVPLKQQCVVSLKPVDEHVHEVFSLLLSTQKEEDLSLDDVDQMDWMHEEHETLHMGKNTTIDIGEILVQYLSLFMNPYPRHPEAILEQQKVVEEKESPLMGLKNLKNES